MNDTLEEVSVVSVLVLDVLVAVLSRTHTHTQVPGRYGMNGYSTGSTASNGILRLGIAPGLHLHI